MLKSAACVTCLTLALSPAAGAQQPAQPAPAGPQRPGLPPPAPKTGNPTPGTPQPDPPVVADRIAVTGCLQMAPGAGPAPATATTVPADNRFVLTGVKKDALLPPDTGTSSAATAASATTYRLEALESQLSPFVNARVELSGGIKGTADRPVVLVEFVRKLAAKCQ